MTFQEFTPIFTITMISIVILYDLTALFFEGVQGTISYWVRETGRKNPLFAAIVGALLVGLLFHFFQTQ